VRHARLLLGGGRRFSCDDGSINHHCGVCAFSDYSVVHRRSIVKIAPSAIGSTV
jgi:alcohol dehydrogenase